MQPSTSPLPPYVGLVADRARLSFLDSQTVTLSRPLTAIAAWNLIMSQPLPGVALAFRIRDAISARFGVKRIGGFSGRRATQPQPGERLDFFLVEEAALNLLVLTERDRHLDVMTCVNTDGALLSITSSVVTQNWYGRLYMLPVAPAHRLLVRWMLARAVRGLRNA